MSGPLVNGFQGSVNNQPAPGQAGDFYGVNPRCVALAGPGQFVAPATGLIVGNFCWANPDTGEVSQSYVAGYQVAMIRRDQQAIIIDFLAPATYLMNPGFPITLFSQGDFWAKFAGGAQPGQKVFANPSTGAPIAGAASGNVAEFTGDAGFVGTGAIGGTFTIAITANVATITLSAAGSFINAGDLVTSANIAGLAIGAQLTGAAGGNGTYTFVHADVAAEAGVSTSTALNITAVTRGSLEVGNTVGGRTITAILTGTGGVGRYTLSGAAQNSANGARTANTTILNVSAVAVGPVLVGEDFSGVDSGAIVSQIDGTPGGVGRYRIAVADSFASGALVQSSVATPWFVNSVAAAGELAKISTWG